jgi:hypothetical protein
MKIRRAKNQSRHQRRNLIATNKIKPERWLLSEAEIIEALKAKGCKVKKIKKICCLKHQVSISYWDEKGGVCSSFFSYRIFVRWQKEVEMLINHCPTLGEWSQINHIMKYEFSHYEYFIEVVDLLNAALENRLCGLRTRTLEAAFC